MSRFLIVDDNTNNLYLLQKILEGHGHSVTTASQGVEALEKARSSPPDLIITDILMPEMDGFSLCKEWRNDPALKTIPFVFYTATYTDPKDEEFALSLGADRFLIKPQEPEIFLSIIQDVLAQYSTGVLKAASPQIEHEEEYYKQHNETLIRKLHQKIQRLEETTKSLQNEVYERKRIEEQLRKSEERYRLVVDHANDVIWSIDAEGCIRFINAAAKTMFGFEPAELIGNPITKIIHSRDLKTLKNEILSTLPEEKDSSGITIELVHQRSDQSECIGETKATPLYDSKGRLLEIIGITRDITEKKKLHEQLLHAQKMEAIGQLAGGVAHDFNNIIVVINGYSGIILRKIPSDDPIRSNLEEIIHAGNRAAALTRQLLAFSRRQVIQPQTVKVQDILQEMEKMLRRLIGEDIQFITEIRADSSWIFIDPGQFEQIIMNLVINARDAMPNGGQLSITIQNLEGDEIPAEHQPLLETGSHVMLAITDTGVGIDAMNLNHIFEPFFTTKECGKGTGLGLSTVYGIVKQNHGHIFVQSKLEAGTTFYVYFPRITEFSETLASNRPAQKTKGTETILVVEDNDPVRKLIVESLTDYGYTILSAKNGIEAIQIYREYSETIDLLLTDMVLPGKSGLLVVQEIRQINPKIKIIYMSGYTDNEIVWNGIHGENISFISKPFHQRTLALKLREVLDEEEKSIS